MEGLNYVEEHQSCLNYRIPQEANIRVLHFPKGTVQFIDTSESLLVFILEGEAWVTSGPYKEVIHRAGYMSLQPRNSVGYIRILTDCTCILRDTLRCLRISSPVRVIVSKVSCSSSFAVFSFVTLASPASMDLWRRIPA